MKLLLSDSLSHGAYPPIPSQLLLAFLIKGKDSHQRHGAVLKHVSQARKSFEHSSC